MVKMTVEQPLFFCVEHSAPPIERRTTEIGPRDSCSESSRSSRCQIWSSSDETASPPPCILQMNLAAVLSSRDRGESS